jgi:hypothetical protein
MRCATACAARSAGRSRRSAPRDRERRRASRDDRSQYERADGPVAHRAAEGQAAHPTFRHPLLGTLGRPLTMRRSLPVLASADSQTNAEKRSCDQDDQESPHEHQHPALASVVQPFKPSTMKVLALTARKQADRPPNHSSGCRTTGSEDFGRQNLYQYLQKEHSYEPAQHVDWPLKHRRRNIADDCLRAQLIVNLLNRPLAGRLCTR